MCGRDTPADTDLLDQVRLRKHQGGEARQERGGLLVELCEPLHGPKFPDDEALELDARSISDFNFLWEGERTGRVSLRKADDTDAAS